MTADKQVGTIDFSVELEIAFLTLKSGVYIINLFAAIKAD
jgi:hypothetical protein